MTLGVSSFFQSKAQSTKVNSIIQRFTFNGSVISGRVRRFDTIVHNAEDVLGATFVLDVENASGDFNSFITDKVQFYKDGSFEFGFATEGGSEDLVQLFGGILTDVSYSDDGVSLRFEDKLALLKDKPIGSDESPVDWTTSDYNLADLAWYAVTSYGGLSAVKSSSNPDIDYATWLSWWTGFDGDSIVVQAYLQGESVTEFLEAAARLSDSTIYDEGDNKLDFDRWTGVTSQTHTVTDSHITELVNIDVTGKEMINQVDVLIGFNPTSDTWAGTISRANTASVNSYGAQAETYDDTRVWFVNSVAAINHADRIVFRRKEPNVVAKVRTPLVFLDAVVGDMVLLTLPQYGFDNRLMTLARYEIDTEDKMMELSIDEGFGRAAGKVQGFILDDGYWGLLDQSYNPLY